MQHVTYGRVIDFTFYISLFKQHASLYISTQHRCKSELKKSEATTFGSFSLINVLSIILHYGIQNI